MSEHDEIKQLLGAFSLDAVTDEEAAAVRRHLERCSLCRQEVRAYQEAAAALSGAGGPAPNGVWDRISGQLAPPVISLEERRRGRSRGLARRVLPAVAAVAAAAVAFLGFEVSHLEGRVSHLQAAVARSGLRAAAASAELASGSKTLWLRSPAAAPQLEAVIRPDGQAYLVRSHLPVLGGSRTYQLWGLVGKRVVSLGLIGDGRAVAAFRLGPGVQALMVTAEPSGGVPAPTTPVLASAKL